jgi:hypothetical protein
MTQETISRHSIRGKVGAALLLIGSTILVGYSAILGWQFQTALDSTAVDSLGCFGSIGVASLRLVRIVALDHAALFWVIHRMLVLCSALIVALIGVALLPKRGTSATLPSKRPLPLSKGAR